MGGKRGGGRDREPPLRRVQIIAAGGLLSFARSVPYIVARGTGWREEQTADG